MFNSGAIEQKGFFPLGKYLNSTNPAWLNTTLDYQLEHMDLSKDSTLNLAFNGTVFNSYTTGYRHIPNISKPISMPYHDPKINSTW